MNNKIKQVVVDNLKEGEYVYAMQQQLSIFKKNKMKTKKQKKNTNERMGVKGCVSKRPATLYTLYT